MPLGPEFDKKIDSNSRYEEHGRPRRRGDHGGATFGRFVDKTRGHISTYADRHGSPQNDIQKRASDSACGFSTGGGGLLRKVIGQSAKRRAVSSDRAGIARRRSSSTTCIASPIERCAADVLEETLERCWRVIVQAASEGADRCARWHLWTFRTTPSFPMGWA